jgi:hypothetical protein
VAGPAGAELRDLAAEVVLAAHGELVVEEAERVGDDRCLGAVLGGRRGDREDAELVAALGHDLAAEVPSQSMRCWTPGATAPGDQRLTDVAAGRRTSSTATSSGASPVTV